MLVKTIYVPGGWKDEQQVLCVVKGCALCGAITLEKLRSSLPLATATFVFLVMEICSEMKKPSSKLATL